jgi:hypothetical protein
MKSGTLGFSFGYLSTASTPRDGGGRNINALDVFEVSACPIPANPATRVLAVKAYDDGRIADAIRHRQLELLIAEARAGLR